jgi:hypothetical protein
MLIVNQQSGFSQTGLESRSLFGKAIDSNFIEIKLTNKAIDSRMGVWVNGDYAIHVELDTLEAHFRQDYTDLLNAMEHLFKDDSAAINRCKIYIPRYLKAVNELNHAENGFDLRQLAVYMGPENEKQNKGNSTEVDRIVRQRVEEGKAAVFFKGERIYTLKKKVRWDHIMTTIAIFYKEEDNWAYNYIGHINW